MPPFQKIQPRRIDQISDSEITIAWSDGRVTRHTFHHLRFVCHCAVCRDEHTGERMIREEEIPPDIRPRKITPVGTYALHFDWSDGHSTGIYSFELLRREDESSAAGPVAPQK